MSENLISINSPETSRSSVSGFVGNQPHGFGYNIAGLSTRDPSAGRARAIRKVAESQIANLTPRQRQVMHLVLAGLPSKNIAATLGISRRTVENHRASIMKKTGSKSIPALACLAFTASWDDPAELLSQYGFDAQERSEMG